VTPPRSTRLLLALYWRSLRLRARLERALADVPDGVWLGLFDREKLAVLDAQFYAQATEPVEGGRAGYDAAEWNRQGLWEWEAAAVDAHFPPGGRVVVTGAGGGREVLGLLGLGFDAVGYEPNADLVAAGRRVLAQDGHGDRLRPMERDAWPADAGACDGVVVGWGSYTLIPGRANRVAFLRRLRGALEPGAPVLVSFFVRGNEATSRRIAQVANVVRRLRRAEPVEVGDGLVPNFVHGFVEAELAAELAEAGFGLVHYAGAPYGHAVARAR